jgi:hypothetical protein
MDIKTMIDEILVYAVGAILFCIVMFIIIDLFFLELVGVAI